MKLFRKPTALITGATSGMGLALAQAFARNGHDLYLVSPAVAVINGVAEDLHREFGVRATPVVADLPGLENTAPFEDFADEVDMLCHCADATAQGYFQDIPLEKHLELAKLNVDATLRLIAVFLPRMVCRGFGCILTTTSLASYEPTPLMASFNAAKAFAFSLMESLANENEDTGVTFTTLSPALVHGEAFRDANFLAVRDVAEATYEAMLAGERTVILDAWKKLHRPASAETNALAGAKTNRRIRGVLSEHRPTPPRAV